LNIGRSPDAAPGVLGRTSKYARNKAVPETGEEIMNEYLMLELARQRIAERREGARKISMMRALRTAMRQRDRDEELVPTIPDYVDGTFRPAGDQVKPANAAR
jgi:hypothetical protein